MNKSICAVPTAALAASMLVGDSVVARLNRETDSDAPVPREPSTECDIREVLSPRPRRLRQRKYRLINVDGNPKYEPILAQQRADAAKQGPEHAQALDKAAAKRDRKKQKRLGAA